MKAPTAVLVKAAIKGNVAEVTRCLAAGASVHTVGGEPALPVLHWAALNARLEVCRILIEKGANVNERDKVLRSTPLMYAASAGHRDVCELLISHGADLEAKVGKYQSTCLMRATEAGHFDTVFLLLAKGGDTSARDADNSTCLMYAIAHTDIVRLLLEREKVDINARDKSGSTCLLEAVKAGQVDTVGLLIRRGADVTISNNEGKSGLDIARLKNFSEITSLLMRAPEIRAKAVEREKRRAYTKERLRLESVELEKQKLETIAKDIEAREKSALLKLYATTGGSEWKHSEGWCDSDKVDVKCWYGVTVENRRVMGLCLRRNNLKGELPSELGVLSELRTLDLSQNALRGAIPEELALLNRLERFTIHGNCYTGDVPTVLSHMTISKNLSAPSLLCAYAVMQHAVTSVTSQRELQLATHTAALVLPGKWRDLAEEVNLFIFDNQHTSCIRNFNELVTSVRAARTVSKDFSDMQDRIRNSGETFAEVDVNLLSERVPLKEKLVESLQDVLQKVEAHSDLSAHFKAATERLTSLLPGSDTISSSEKVLDCSTCVSSTASLGDLDAPSHTVPSHTAVAHVHVHDVCEHAQNEVKLDAETVLECSACTYNTAISGEEEGALSHTTPNRAHLHVQDVAHMQAHVHAVCEHALNEIKLWEGRHDFGNAIKRTDAALQALADAGGGIVACGTDVNEASGHTMTVSDLLRAADYALEAERMFFRDDKPSEDIPTEHIVIACCALRSLYADMAKQVEDTRLEVNWVNEELVALTPTDSIPYPPPLDELAELMRSLRRRNRSIDYIKFDIKNPAPDTDIFTLTTQLENLQKDKRGRRLCSDIMRVKSELIYLAQKYYPELLMRGHSWYKAVCISEEGIDMCNVDVNLFALGRRLDDFSNVTQVYIHTYMRKNSVVYIGEDADGVKYMLIGYKYVDIHEKKCIVQHAHTLHTLCKHTHLTEVTAVFVDQGAVYIQMPCYVGGYGGVSLQQMRHPEVCKQLVCDILRGVAHIHAHVYVHCDVRAEHICVTKSGRAVLGGLECVRHVRTQEPSLPRMYTCSSVGISRKDGAGECSEKSSADSEERSEECSADPRSLPSVYACNSVGISSKESVSVDIRDSSALEPSMPGVYSCDSVKSREDCSGDSAECSGASEERSLEECSEERSSEGYSGNTEDCSSEECSSADSIEHSAESEECSVERYAEASKELSADSSGDAPPRSLFTFATDMYAVGVIVQELFQGVELTNQQAVLRDTFVRVLKEGTCTCMEALNHPFLVKSNSFSEERSLDSKEHYSVDSKEGSGSSGLSRSVSVDMCVVEEIEHQCCICRDIFSENSGIICMNGRTASTCRQSHFTCTECFDAYILSKATSTCDNTDSISTSCSVASMYIPSPSSRRLSTSSSSSTMSPGGGGWRGLTPTKSRKSLDLTTDRNRSHHATSTISPRGWRGLTPTKTENSVRTTDRNRQHHGLFCPVRSCTSAPFRLEEVEEYICEDTLCAYADAVRKEQERAGLHEFERGLRDFKSAVQQGKKLIFTE